jgi:uncharacterized coiled-coil DUF342 family protein
MLQETLKRIDQIIAQSDKLSSASRQELADLLSQLDKELQAVEKQQAHKAHSIASFAKVAAHESLRDDPDPELVSLSSKGLRRTVEEFEASHPKLYEVIQAICIRLTGMGV